MPNVEDWTPFLQEKEWTQFATFTTAKPITLKSARRLMEKVATRVLKANEYMFWAAERFDLGREGYHMHALINTRHSAKQIEDWYKEHYGRCDVSRYNPERGAAHYCAKYMTKHVFDYDFLLGKGESELFKINGKKKKSNLNVN